MVGVSRECGQCHGLMCVLRLALLLGGLEQRQAN
jgi:hypothetical protein